MTQPKVEKPVPVKTVNIGGIDFPEPMVASVNKLFSEHGIQGLGTKVVGDGKTSGRNTGLNVATTWTMLFEANKELRLHDDRLCSFMKDQFPKRDAKTWNRISDYRHYFNKGTNSTGYGSELMGSEKSVSYGGSKNVTQSPKPKGLRNLYGSK